MKNIYFAIIDTTQPNDSYDFACFLSKSCMTDLAGCIMQFARANKTNPDNMRLYIYPTKQDWNNDYCKFVERFTLRMRADMNGLSLNQQRALNDLCDIIETECV